MKILEEKDKARYKEFLEKHNRCNFQQSLEWGDVKVSWKKEVVLSEDENGNIVGSICVWIRKIPIFGNLMYSARGPICDIHDENVLKDLTDGLNEIAKRYNAFVDDSDNAETFFSRIVKGGYAEDPKYLEKILRVYYSV